MLELECKVCHTGIFRVDSVSGLGNLPQTFTCHICGAKYTAEVTKAGELLVYEGELRKSEPKVETTMETTSTFATTKMVVVAPSKPKSKKGVGKKKASRK